MSPGLEKELPSLPVIVSIAETVWAPRAGGPRCESTATERHEHPLSEKDWQASRVLQRCCAVLGTFEWLCICHGSSLAELLCSTPGLSFQISLQNRLCTSSLTFSMSVCEDRAEKHMIWWEHKIWTKNDFWYPWPGGVENAFLPVKRQYCCYCTTIWYDMMICYDNIYIIDSQSSSYGA